MDTAISRFAQDKIAAGNSGLLLIADNYDAFAARILAARSATSSLDLMYYLWHDDHSGRLLMQEVVKAAERGVRVRLLLDDINPRNSDAAYLALNSYKNIELRLFNPSGMRNGSIFRSLEMVARLFAMTRRMHNKAWIADESLAIVGGRNIGDAYFDAAETNFRDLDLLLLGPAVGQTMQIFEAFWNCEAAKPIQLLNPATAGSRADFLDNLDATADGQLLNSLRAWRTITEFIVAHSDVCWTKGVRVISDPPEKVRGKSRRNWLTKELLPAIAATRQRLEIVSPYFIPSRTGLAILSKLVDRGAEVAILTNSLAATDVAAVHGAYAKYRRKLLKKGIQLFELQPFDRQANISVFGSKGASLHTKAFTVDDTLGFVGSFNFDPRSVSLNAEMGVLFHDTNLVMELRRRFEREKSAQTSYQLVLDKGALRWLGMADGEMRQYSHEPEASLYRRIVAALVGCLPIESQL
ncbi:phospholipase D family protein [Mesorhizobium sp. M0915]|uniref:phospholipase D family protein n=1 Tax=unclassified Mesorhizobium TaxID=325217 RepID=UPI0003CDF5F5|nr:phospholipase D family protein [Mesorhizobium sp. LSHC420B00]ESX70600.1 cardiolipin synthase [Mesorhizobium sp. LSHC420B00]